MKAQQSRFLMFACGLVVFVATFAAYNGLEASPAKLSDAPAKLADISKEELTKRLAFYSSVRSFRVHFKQIKHLKEMSLDLLSEGELTLDHGKGVGNLDIVWEVTKPSHLIVKINTAKVTVKTGVGDEATVQSFSRADMAKGGLGQGFDQMTPWLSLDAEKLHAKYDVTKDDDRHLIFIPKTNEHSPFLKMSLSLDKYGHAKTVLLSEASGDSLEIEFDVPRVLR